MKRHVLIVEDDLQTITILNFILTHAGYVTKVAGNGYDALDYIERFKFDLVLLDLNMPMMNGFDFLERLNARGKIKMPIFVLTVRNDKSSILKAKKLGAEHYIVKPPEKQLLLKKIENALGGSPQYYTLEFDEDVREAGVQLTYQCQMRSISETGMVLLSPIPIDMGAFLPAVKIPLFEQLGINNPRLKVCECKKDEKKVFKYEIFISFVDLGEAHLKKLREWLIGECLRQVS